VKKARFTKQARAELLEQVAYYEAEEPGLGVRFLSEVQAAAARAASFPKHGRPAAARTRRRLVVDFKFSLFYTEVPGGVLIHAVASQRRAPEYWVGRLP
jgi:toxin ParE1/3/4